MSSPVSAVASELATGAETAGAGGVIRTRDVPVGDYVIHLNESGDPSAPAVLWLHGSGPGIGALNNWDRLITDTADRYYNLAPDVLGFGRSSHPDPPPLGLTAFTELRAQVMLEMLDALGIDQVDLVGNSMGGMISLTMMRIAPERIRRVVLMGSGGAPQPPQPALIEMVRFYENPTPENMASLMRNFVYDTATFDGRLDEIAADRVTKAMRPEVKRSHLAQFDMTAGKPLSFSPDQLAALDHQVLIIHGREDKMVLVEGSYYMEEHLPNARLLILPQAGHWVQIEAADRFRSVVDLFLAGSL